MHDIINTVNNNRYPEGSNMQNIIEYALGNMKTMTQKEFNPVDSLILSKLSYIRFENLVPLLSKRAHAVRVAEILKAEMFESMFKYISDAQISKKFLCALAASPRYRNIKMNFYMDKIDSVAAKQFAAVTFILEDKTAYVAFRGTDTTFVGWKEDFNMAFISPIPSQEESVQYLNKVAKRLPRAVRIRVGGHSKGGNLAVYSAVKCKPSVQNRIVKVYNHDGPGFKNGIFDSPEFSNIKGRIHTTIPEASLVGMLLSHHEDYSVVKSSRKGIMQHDPFSWDIDGDDFVYADGVKNSAAARNKALNDWLSTLQDEQRRKIVDVLFGVLEKTNSSTFQELSESWSKSASAMLTAVKDIDPESRKFIAQTISELAKISVKNIFKSK